MNFLVLGACYACVGGEKHELSILFLLSQTWSIVNICCVNFFFCCLIIKLFVLVLGIIKFVCYICFRYFMLLFILHINIYMAR